MSSNNCKPNGKVRAKSSSASVGGETQTPPTFADAARVARTAKAQRARRVLQAAGFSCLAKDIELGHNLFIGFESPPSRPTEDPVASFDSSSRQKRRKVEEQSIERARRSLKRAGLDVEPIPIAGRFYVAFRDEVLADKTVNDSPADSEALLPNIKEIVSLNRITVAPNVLRFVRRGSDLVAEPCRDMETVIANTYKVLLLHMGECRSIVRSRGGKITASSLKSNFKNTYFVKALDMSDWNLLIDELSKKRSAGDRNLTVALLSRRTGKRIATVETYTRPGRKRKKTAN
jgi:hypothetical protein